MFSIAKCHIVNVLITSVFTIALTFMLFCSYVVINNELNRWDAHHGVDAQLILQLHC